MAGKRSGAFVVGVMLGAAAGAVAGLLTAPRAGQETRRILRKSADALPDLAEDVSTTVQLQADKISETALKNWDLTLGRLKDAIAAGMEATRQAQQSPTGSPSASKATAGIEDEAIAGVVRRRNDSYSNGAEDYRHQNYRDDSSIASEID
jgi:gas vesicle protein